MHKDRAGSPERAWQEHSGPVVDQVDGFDVIECRPCGFTHVVPLPTPEALDEIYRHDYYSREKPLYIERYREDLEWWNLVYDGWLDSLESLLPPDRRRLLDIGSGPGFFLLRARERGWTVLGIEPSVQAAEHTRGLGLEVVNDFLTPDNAGTLGPFDAVFMSEVLEHLPDPAGMLALAHGLLAPGGILGVLVPNDYNPVQQAARSVCGLAPWWVAPPHHLNYFSPDTLAALVERCGFRERLREATFPIDLFLLMGENYIGNDVLGRQCHGRRMRLEQALDRAGLRDWKRRLYRCFAAAGLGREVILFAERPAGAGDSA